MSEYIRREDILDAFGLSEKTRKYGGDHSGYDTMMLYEIQDTIESLEPADVAPVVHATWYDDGTELGCQCSKCGKTLDDYVRYDMDADIGLVEIPNFCPNCGAKMDGGENG